MEKKIYIVTAGEYSDYHIGAVFSTKEKAKEFVQRKGTDSRIEEYTIDDAQFDRGTKIWQVSIDLTTNRTTQAIPYDATWKPINKFKDICTMRDLYGEQCDLFIEADTMDRAIKIAKERYFALKSNQYIWEKMNTKEKVQTPYFLGLREYPCFNFATNEFVNE